MQVSKCRFKGLSALRVATDNAVLTILLSMGPRIISLKRQYGGKELMYHSHSDKLDYVPQKWYAMGGARVWTHDGYHADETERSYASDNARCKWDADPACVTVWGAAHKDFAIQRGLEICETGTGALEVTSLVRNCSDGGMLLNAGVWAITAVRFGDIGSTALGILTNDRESNWQVGRHQIVWHWGGGHHTTPGFMKGLRIEDGLLRVTPMSYEGKVMAFSPVGAIVTTTPDTSFFKLLSEPDPRLSSLLPGGCNTAIYACNDFAESETMGPATAIRAGQTLRHTERWVLTEPHPWNAEHLYEVVAAIK